MQIKESQLMPEQVRRKALLVSTRAGIEQLEPMGPHTDRNKLHYVSRWIHSYSASQALQSVIRLPLRRRSHEIVPYKSVLLYTLFTTITAANERTRCIVHQGWPEDAFTVMTDNPTTAAHLQPTRDNIVSVSQRT
jgi:hypothetical protein